MRRLCGERGTEKIIFGREIRSWYIRRVCAGVICVAVIGVMAWILGVNLAWGGDTQTDVTEGENTSAESVGAGGIDDEINDPKEDETHEESTTKIEEATKENPIIYKDFSKGYLDVVNNTIFDVSFLYNSDFSCNTYYDKNSKKPLVLVLHSYTSDRYLDSTGRYGVCSVGQALVDELNSMGIGAIYSSAVHDSDMGDPYENARETIEFYLKMYPTVKYVFDVGVMQEYDGERVVATSGKYMGQSAAQIRFLACGNNLTTGRNNLYLASQISKNLNLGDMNLSREIVYDNSIKNSILTPYYLEIFIGSSGNTEAEAILSARALACAFAGILI